MIGPPEVSRYVPSGSHAVVAAMFGSGATLGGRASRGVSKLKPVTNAQSLLRKMPTDVLTVWT